MMPEEVAQDPRAYLVARTVPTARSVGITTAPLVLAGSPSAGRPRARVVASRRSVGRSVLVALGGSCWQSPAQPTGPPPSAMRSQS